MPKTETKSQLKSIRAKALLASIALLIFASMVSAPGLGQNMLFHLLGVGEGTINFTATAQNFNEADGTFGAWPVGLNDWTYRRQISFDGVSGSVSNFPVLVKLDSTRINYANVKAAGADLRFADDAGTILPHEIEIWDTTGTSLVWVRLPSLPVFPGRRSIWMYYGNAAAADSQAPLTLWGTNHHKIFHFNGTLGAAIANGATIAASHGNNGTANNADGTGLTYGAGIVGTGITLDGTDDWVAVGADANLNFGASAPFTFSTFVKTTDASGPIIMFRDAAAGTNVLGMYIGQNGASNNPGRVNLLIRDSTNGTYAQLLGPTISDGNWHNVAITRNSGSTISLFVDGVAYGTASAAGTGGAFTTDLRAIGSDRYWVSSGNNAADDRYLSGQFDEVRISGVQHDVAYFEATHLAVSDLLSYYRSEETKTIGVAPVTVGLNSPASSAITIPYTVSGTAAAGTDHDRVSGNIVIGAGEISAPLDVRVFRDQLVESNETVILTLGTPSGASLGNDIVHTITIIEETLSPPDAINDAIDVVSLSPIVLNVLGNDTDANGDLLTVTSFTAPGSGSISKSGSVLTYTPSEDFPATTSFTYTVSDGRGGSDTATVTLNYKIPFTWTGLGSDDNWSNGGNWLGGVAPGATNPAYFNDQCASNCDVTTDAAISVQALRLNSSFTGTVTQGPGRSLSVGSGGWTQRAGVFNGSNAQITVTHPLRILGGNFQSTTGELRIGSALTSRTIFEVGAAATFQHNTGSVYFAGSQPSCTTTQVLAIDVAASLTLNNVTFYGDFLSLCAFSAHEVSAGDTLIVSGNLTHSGGYILGNLELKGNLIIAGGAGGTGLITMNGSGVQTYSWSAGAYGSRTSGLRIDKSSGTVESAVGNLNLYTDRFLLIGGTFSAPSGIFDVRARSFSDTIFQVATGSTFADNGGSTVISGLQPGCVADQTFTIDVPDMFQFNDLTVNGDNASACGRSQISLVSGRTLVVMGNFVHSGAGGLHGTYDLKGNYSSNASGASAGTATMRFTGLLGQTISSSVGQFPGGPVHVAKLTGTLSFASAGVFTAASQAMTIQRGTVNLAGFNLTVAGLLTIDADGLLLCNGGTVTAGSTSIAGEMSCGSSIGITWTGAAGTGLWSTAGNWTNNTVPGSTDLAMFNSKCGSNCNAAIASNLIVRGLTLRSDYTGTLTQNAGITLTVGSGGYSQAAGTFAGSDAAITMTHLWALSGGTFTATSGTMSIGQTGCAGTTQVMNVTGGTFNHANGKLRFQYGRPLNGSCQSDGKLFFPPGFTVYDLELFSEAASGGWYSNLSLSTGSATTLRVLNRYYDYGPIVNVGVDVEGDIFLGNTNGVSLSPITLKGAASQQYTRVGSTISQSLKVDKTGGTVTPAAGTTSLGVFTFDLLQGKFQAPTGVMQVGALTFASISTTSFSVADGTVFDVNGGTIRHALARYNTASANTTSTIVVPVGFEFNNVEVVGEVSVGGFQSYIASASPIVVAGNLTYSGMASTASWNVRGDVTINGNAGGGSGTISLVGNANQTLSGVSSARPPKLRFASTGGIVTLSGNITTNADWTHLSGLVDPGTSTVTFDPQSAMVVSPNTMTFNNLVISGYTGSIALTGTIEVLGTTTFSGSSSSPTVSVNGGTIRAHGNVTFASIGVTGTTILKIGGSTNQTITGGIGSNALSIEIDSSGGTVTLAGTITTSRTYNHINGTVDAGTSTFVIAPNSHSPTIVSNTTIFNNLTLNGYVTNFNISGTLITTGTLSIAGTSSSPIPSVNGSTLEVRGNLAFSSFGSTGNAPVLFTGATASSYTTSVSASRMSGGTTISKTGAAVVSLAQDSTFGISGEDVTISTGVLSLSGYTFSVADTITVGASGTLRCAGGTFTSANLVNNGTLECPGYPTYPFNWTGTIGDGNFATAGNWQGGVAPGASDVVVFNNAYCGVNCSANISSSTSIRGLIMESGYSGTLAQAIGAAISIGNRGWRQISGTFSGSNAAITNTGDFLLAGGTFNSTTGTFTTSGTNWNASGGTFNHGTGTVAMDVFIQTVNINAGSNAFHSLSLIGWAGSYAFTGTTTVNGLLEFGSGSGQGTHFTGGPIEAKGNVTAVGSGTGSHTAAAVISISGSSNQTLTSSGGNWPGILFNSTGGSVSLVGNFIIRGTFSYVTGTVVPGTSMVEFRRAAGAQVISPNGMTLQNVSFAVESSSTEFNLSSQTLNVGGNLSFDSSMNSALLNSGVINVSGNVSTTGSGTLLGSANINIIGGANSSLSQSAGSKLPGATVTINKPGATLNMVTAARLNNSGQNLNIAAGTLNMAGFDLSVGNNISNAGIIQRGTSPMCGAISQGGAFTGNVAVCP